MSRQRGFALLVVLWSMALLALLGAQLTGAGRTEAQIARNLRASAGVEAAADGAVQEAIFHLLASGEARWGADGVVRRWRIGEAAVEVRIFSESGKLNPNRAPIAVMAALLRRLGAEPRQAGQVAAAIFDWRTPGQRASPGGAKAAEYRAAGRDVVPTGRPFESLDELGAVLGMTPALLAALRPSLSIYNEAGLDVRYAPPAVVLALADIGMEFDPPTEARQAVTIVATAGLAEGARFRRQAVVRILGIADEHPWQILAWERADG